MTDQLCVTAERGGHLLLMGLNRADDRNFFDFAMLEQLATAYGRLASDPDLRVAALLLALIDRHRGRRARNEMV